MRFGRWVPGPTGRVAHWGLIVRPGAKRRSTVFSSPFDTVKAEGEGHVVHLGEPRFVARWFAGDRPLNPTDTVSGIVYHNQELDITVCEVVVFDEQRSAFDEWLVEATAAIARWRGDSDSAEPEIR